MILEEDYFYYWVIAILSVSLLSGVIILFASYYGEVSCKAKAAMMVIPFRYTMLTGCMVEVTGTEGNRFMPLTSLRIYSHVQ